MMLLLTDIPDHVFDGSNRRQNFEAQVLRGKAEAEENPTYSLQTQNYPLVRQNENGYGEIYLDRASRRHPVLADFVEKYVDIRFRAAGVVRNPDRDFWPGQARDPGVRIRRTLNTTRTPHFYPTRPNLIGQMIHGGDVEADLAICSAVGTQQSLLKKHHGDRFGEYIEAAFKNFYFGPNPATARWLVLRARAPPGPNTALFKRTVKFINFWACQNSSCLDRFYSDKKARNNPALVTERSHVLLPPIHAMFNYVRNLNSICSHYWRVPGQQTPDTPMILMQQQKSEIARLRALAHAEITQILHWDLQTSSAA
ncbi:hypothetical protein B0T14DRAFT_557719 [Immersiella caudata]|uniref:Uncharacterized protein n=1 Tax=Immersiella caudata TaxID=314043 RepID=A0AA39WFJ6_9PEZI|nr:hypothetical protein B0T14DRAFT_557719 [Immersiella caudata]